MNGISDSSGIFGQNERSLHRRRTRVEDEEEDKEEEVIEEDKEEEVIEEDNDLMGHVIKTNNNVKKHIADVNEKLILFIDSLIEGFLKAKQTYLDMCIKLRSVQKKGIFQNYEFYLKIYIYINIIIDLLETIKAHIISGAEFELGDYNYSKLDGDQPKLEDEFNKFNTKLNISPSQSNKIKINELHDQIWSAAKNIDIFKNNNNTSPPPPPGRGGGGDGD
jgi:hypothetical protein